MKKWLATYIFLTCLSCSFGQAEISIVTPKDSIWLGEKIVATVSYKGFNAIPNISDKKLGGFDVLMLDSVKRSEYGYTQDILLQTFDTSYVVLGPVRLIQDTDTVVSNPILVYVNYAKVDMSKPEKSIFPPIDTPLAFYEYIILFFVWYWWIILIIILLTIIAALIVIYRNKKAKSPTAPELPKVPLDEEFIEKLNIIKQKELWLKGNIKEHHTEITFTIREYLSRRYNINALELTTHETLDILKTSSISYEQKENLKVLLSLADLVKFAKEQPSAAENERLIVIAKEFIMATKPKATSGTF